MQEVADWKHGKCTRESLGTTIKNNNNNLTECKYMKHIFELRMKDQIEIV